MRRRPGGRGSAAPPPGAPQDPVRDLLALKERMNRLLEGVLGRGDFGGLPGGWQPPLALVEEDDRFVLTVELPGVRRDDVRIVLSGPAVTLSGERRLPGDVRPAEALRIERAYGPFTRTVHLPSPVDPGRASANLGVGVLEVVLPKAARGRTAPVRVAIARGAP